MFRPRMRPSFAVVVACSREQILVAIRRHLILDAREVEGEVSAHRSELRIPIEERRFWTPYLDLTIENIECRTELLCTDRSKLWGTFSPRPEIWTAFVFAIGTLAFVSIFFSIYGIAQISLGHAPFVLLVPIIAILLAVGGYFSAPVGQGMSISQMY